MPQTALKKVDVVQNGRCSKAYTDIYKTRKTFTYISYPQHCVDIAFMLEHSH